ncbi:MAG: helix-turn-helix domain-containing protein [Promethearchaeota archaeon]
MKAIRLQLPGNFLKYLGFHDIFQDIEWIEILQAFQYDSTHLFSIQRMKFMHSINDPLDVFIQTKFNPKFYQVLNVMEDEMTCILNQTRSSGFFPIIESGPWAFRFPIHVSKEKILLSMIVQEEYLPKLYEILMSFTNTYEILASTDLDKIEDIKDFFGAYFLPFPNFTRRQRELATYAAEKGYFQSPKKISAKDIAKKFNISVTAVNKHMNNIKNIAMEYFFGKPERYMTRRRNTEL